MEVFLETCLVFVYAISVVTCVVLCFVMLTEIFDGRKKKKS